MWGISGKAWLWVGLFMVMAILIAVFGMALRAATRNRPDCYEEEDDVDADIEKGYESLHPEDEGDPEDLAGEVIDDPWSDPKQTDWPNEEVIVDGTSGGSGTPGT